MNRNIIQKEFELYCERNPDITKLDIDNCRNITNIPNLEELTVLRCFDCTGLTSLPVLKNLTYLYCSG